jgi:hypothetical protein
VRPTGGSNTAEARYASRLDPKTPGLSQVDDLATPRAAPYPRCAVDDAGHGDPAGCTYSRELSRLHIDETLADAALATDGSPGSPTRSTRSSGASP